MPLYRKSLLRTSPTPAPGWSSVTCTASPTTTQTSPWPLSSLAQTPPPIARHSPPSARALPHSVRAPPCSKYTFLVCASFFCVFPFYSYPKYNTPKWGPPPETALGKGVLGADTGSGRVVGSLWSLMALPGLIPLSCFWIHLTLSYRRPRWYGHGHEDLSACFQCCHFCSENLLRNETSVDYGRGDVVFQAGFEFSIDKAFIGSLHLVGAADLESRGREWMSRMSRKVWGLVGNVWVGEFNGILLWDCVSILRHNFEGSLTMLNWSSCFGGWYGADSVSGGDCLLRVMSRLTNLF